MNEQLRPYLFWSHIRLELFPWWFESQSRFFDLWQIKMPQTLENTGFLGGIYFGRTSQISVPPSGGADFVFAGQGSPEYGSPANVQPQTMRHASPPDRYRVTTGLFCRLGSGWDSLSHSLSVFEIEHSFYFMDLSYHSFGAKAIQLTKHAPGNSRGMSIFRDNRGIIPLAHSAFCAFRLSLAKFYLDDYLNIA